MNECLYKGPQLTPLPFDILLQFRAQVIALTADIEKAFHQISEDNDDRDYLRLLWLDNKSFDEPTITRNRFARVIFGITSSPFCLNSTIQKHVNQYSDNPEFVKKALKSFFVDDFISAGKMLKRRLSYSRVPNNRPPFLRDRSETYFGSLKP